MTVWSHVEFILFCGNGTSTTVLSPVSARNMDQQVPCKRADLPKGVKDRALGEKEGGERGTERPSDGRMEIK
ncbi:hypothetical protein AMECASPLE_034717 [Ameca splendens]|uniref:Uncharacterized protein n=1 Tax=Ameca splendens TaxID=208324 RepID=A0ABV0XW52_9TELE